jgi:hypothetical protein
MANICGESFLLVARDGDLTPAFARWAIDLEIETEASHLVVVATGRLHNQAQVLLLNHSRRRIRAGRDFELVLADDPVSAGKELKGAFERVSQRIVAEQVCELDYSLGLSVARIIIDKFKFLRSEQGAENEAPPANDSVHNSTPAAPLALAAHATAGAARTNDVATQVNVEFSDQFDDAHLDEFETPLNSEHRIVWNE